MRKDLPCCSPVTQITGTTKTLSLRLLMVMYLLAGTFIISSGQLAGTAPVNPPFGGFRIDGNVVRAGGEGDWTGTAAQAPNTYVLNPTTGAPLVVLAFRLFDRYNDQALDDIFDGGNKLFHDPNTWGWRSQKPPAKDDINNGAALLTMNPLDGHIWLVIAGDRMSTNGTSYLDFELYKNPITKTGGPLTGGFNSTGPNGGRTIGDISITLQYTAGGSFAAVSFLKWTNTSETTFDYVDTVPPLGSAYAAANGGNIPIPYGAFGNNSYEPLQFIEGAIDITRLLGVISSPADCARLPFSSLFIKTKSSAEKTADLKDFIEPIQFRACFDRTPPTFTSCPGPQNLGCNPTGLPLPDGAVATDNCGVVEVSSSEGAVQVNGCQRTQIRTYLAEDACGNTATCIQTFTWTVDTEGPAITITGGNLNPGCNPEGAINFGSASATDNCSGAVTLTSTAGSITTTGCTRTQTMTWNASSGCSQSSSTSRTATWTVDTQGPVITITGGNLNPGCNPGTVNFGSASANDNCSGASAVTSTAGTITTSGCSRTQTMTWNASDACNNSSSTSRTATWTVDTDGPVITVTGGNLNPGCNPTGIDFGSASANDNCSGARAVTSTAGSITTSGCTRTQTMTWNASDACNNSSSTSRTATWTVDTEGPAITITGGNLNPGCNPGAINFGSASANDNCSGARAVTSTAGSITTSGCTRTQTMTWNASDACNNSSSTSRTATWTVDTDGPVITVTGGNLNPGCNPASIDFGSASANDNCSGARAVTSTAGSITTTGCTRTQTMTWNASDACNNSSSTSRTATWTVDTDGPVITITGGNLNPGCNPESINFGSASANDNCSGARAVTSTAGSITTTGCTRTQTMTWNASDACNNSSSTSRTATWTVDTQGPVITITGGNLNPGCNPASIDFGSASANDNCSGARAVTSTAGSITTTGCTRTQTMTWNASDACNNSSSTSRTATWTVDTDGPVITITGGNLNPGCNPQSIDFGSASANDNCSGARAVTSTAGSITTTGCTRTQTMTWNASDACNNSSSTSRTATWTVDTDGPVITITGGNLNPGCNPESINFGSASANDNCSGARAVTSTAGSITTSGCTRTQTMTWNASDACNNSSSTSRTATWTVDTQGPVITITGGNLNPGCNPASIDFGSASANDNCSGARAVTSTAGSITTTGCTRTQTMTWNASDACNNSSSTSRTATWTVDTDGPVITITGGNLNPGCNPQSIDFGSASANDNCSGARAVTSTAGSITTTGCTRTQTMTWNASDACNNSSSTSRTATWTVDTDGPVITITGGNLNPGCNPESINFGSASANDNCSGARAVTSTAGSITTTGCTRTQTMTWNASDACNNSSSTSRTATWTVDTQGPVITVTGGNLNPGCNPQSIDFGSASANDNCSGARAVTSTAGSITTSGCTRTQTMTWNASDACNNSSSTSRTATWTVDTDGPVITITGGNLNPGCNPASIDFGSASANDNCSGARAVTSTAGSITTTGCTRTQTMTWNASDACNNSSSTSRTATWTVDTQGPVITITGGNLNPGCNPASIDFGSASANDNCSGARAVTSTAGSITTSGCTRTQTMTWNASDACNNSSSTSRTATWTVDITGPVITITGGNLNPGCNPASINFGSASANDNCSGARAVTSTAGSITTTGCTRTQTMTWNASDACNNSSSTSRTATWTVDVLPPVFTNPPASVDLDCSAAIPTVPTVTATDNCGGTPGVVYNGQTDNPSNCQTGFQRIIVRTWTATDGCGNTAVHTQTIRVKCCVPICTLTQGGYGQYGGNICLPNGTTVRQHEIMVTALNAAPGDSVVFGRQSNNRYWVVTLDDVDDGANSNILKMLPGGGGSFVLGLDTYSNAPKFSNGPSWPVVPLQPNGSQAGRIKNTLLAQTITFYFNTTIAGSGLGSLVLNGDSAIISDRVCGSLVPVPGTRDTVELISPTIVSYMAGHGYPATAAGLLQLANDALGGVNVSPLSLSDIAGAVDRINNVFDNCVLLEGYVPYVSSIRASTNQVKMALPANELNVTAFPNPYEDQNFSLRINAPVSGQATIEFFTIDGQKISEIKRTIVANRDEVVTFKVPGVQKSKIAYVVKVGKYNSKGIVLSPN